MARIYNLNKLLDRRKKLRSESTAQEKILWWYLKNKKIGYKFRRQHSIGGYILDFYCAEKRLLIEVDGGIHNKKENKENDKIRDKFFTTLGLMILRFPNDQVDKNVEYVIKVIQNQLGKR